MQEIGENEMAENKMGSVNLANFPVQCPEVTSKLFRPVYGLTAQLLLGNRKFIVEFLADALTEQLHS